MGLILMMVMGLTASVQVTPETVGGVLEAKGIPIEKVESGAIISEWVYINIEDLNGYIIENFPDENPGWTKGRYCLHITIEKNRIEIEAKFERFGVPNAYLLIPPDWVAVPSNGKLEKELLEDIKTEEER